MCAGRQRAAVRNQEILKNVESPVTRPQETLLARDLPQDDVRAGV